ncbi:hypothetical protein ACFRIC_29455 [Streptomyces sp. NPDC056738]|uniref:hypothetical protein n=1 Tax=Streptomyces sp. NPDC056738 TaxID=3345933 RepID=UPI003697A56F
MRSQGWIEVIAEISPQGLEKVSLEIIKGSLEFFRPSFSAVFSEATVQFVHSAIELGLRGGVGQEEADRMSGRLYALADEDPAIGTASLAAALSLYFDCAAGGFDADSTLEIMSSCYEAVLHTEGLSQDLLDSERDNDHCSRLIDFQWGTLLNAASTERE